MWALTNKTHSSCKSVCQVVGTNWVGTFAREPGNEAMFPLHVCFGILSVVKCSTQELCLLHLIFHNACDITSNQVTVVVYHTVTLSTEASPTDLPDSLNHFTIFTQPPHSFAACLAGCRQQVVFVHLIPQQLTVGINSYSTDYCKMLKIMKVVKLGMCSTERKLLLLNFSCKKDVI